MTGSARPQSRSITAKPNAWRQRMAAGLAAALIGTLALMARPAQASDDPPGRVGRITESRGQSWQWDPESGEWVAVQRNRPVTSGDRLSVEPDGRLELRIGSSTVRLAGGTELEMRRLDDARIEMRLAQGSAALRVRSPEVAREIELATEEGRFLPRRPGHYRIDRRGDSSSATAWSGTIRFEAPDSALAVSGGRSAEFWQEGPQRTSHYSWVEPTRDEFADWAVRNDREDDRLATPRYVSPEMTGWEDLDRYGRWDSHPEYGSVWIPATVVAGWAPYRYGHWAWVAPWGWTWVDDAPWGFAPFHYGRWVMWGSRWCWTPGAYIARPVYAPALVAWVGGAGVSVNIAVGAPPVVGWVPLAPREVYHPYYPRAVSGVYLRGVNPGHPNVQPPPRVPAGPIMYTNQGVPGAVTVVPSTVLSARRPVAPAVAQVDPTVRNDLARLPTQRHDAPPPPSRVQALPTGAVPAVGPGARPGGRAVAPVQPQVPQVPQGQRPPSPQPQVVPPAVQPAPAQTPGQPAPGQVPTPPRAQPPAIQPQPQRPGLSHAPGQPPDAPVARERVPQRPGAAVQAAPPSLPPPVARERRGDEPRGERMPRQMPPGAGVQPVPPTQSARPVQPQAPREVQRVPPGREVREVHVPQHPQQAQQRPDAERRQPNAPRNQIQ
ncbi:MAG: DUF6600 domain-containing protein [Burkholderiaceae bacterium]